MNIVDLLVTIVVVTILVTIVLAIMTYVAYKLRLSREPSRADEMTGPQYFVAYPPPGLAALEAATSGVDGAAPGIDADARTLEPHATEA